MAAILASRTMMGRGPMSVGVPVWVDVDDGGDWNIEGMVKLVFDGVSCLMTSGYGHVRIDGNGG